MTDAALTDLAARFAEPDGRRVLGDALIERDMPAALVRQRTARPDRLTALATAFDHRTLLPPLLERHPRTRCAEAIEVVPPSIAALDMPRAGAAYHETARSATASGRDAEHLRRWFAEAFDHAMDALRAHNPGLDAYLAGHVQDGNLSRRGDA